MWRDRDRRFAIVAHTRNVGRAYIWWRMNYTITKYTGYLRPYQLLVWVRGVRFVYWFDTADQAQTHANKFTLWK